MRIGIVVDSACDLPPDWLQAHDVKLLPVTVRIGDSTFVDLRDARETLAFVDAHVAERGHTAETAAFGAEQIEALFLEQLVIDYDYVFCITVTRNRSQIHENATQASFGILGEYKPVRMQAGHTTPFALRIVDTQQVFAGQGILPVEAVRLRDAGATAPEIRSRLEFLAERSYAYMVPRDLGYLRARIKHRGDRSVSLLSALIGGALDIKPILHCHRGETGPVGKVRGFAPAAEKLFAFTAGRVRAGLLTPTVCLSYGGELDEMRQLPGYDALVAACAEHNVERFETVMSMTGMVNVGAGSLTVGFAAPPQPFS
ncbi:DegV family protein [Luteimonas sp. BDR2-5]|uniref:DegV family protein n=1 Tax=Proluteimonas luteida TaxID=2878685 RepID=UPI001E40C35B|nr:DegV family protein [Luteimonas sp. BDR2-5]MCD9029134.1 DegV family protein [Luteimonas sp. BDR2-5]